MATAVPPGDAAGAGPCLGDTDPGAVAVKPGHSPLRFGITPGGQAGALGPGVTVTPGDHAKTLAALAKLRPEAPFVLRLNRFFWSRGDGGFQAFLRRARAYTRRGFEVELQLRYHPRPDQEGDIPAWKRFVERVVRRFGADPGVVALQIANEVNFYPIAPDASDSSFDGARSALIRGVIAARREARRLGYDRLRIGFNWAYRTDPDREASFWQQLGDRGGGRFRRAVDWVGLDAYPGTVFPPTEPPGGEDDGIVNAMSQLRDCYMPIAGLGPRVPIHVEENGWPTGPGRTEQHQVQALRLMVRAVNRFRGTYGVSDYRWFDLRDHDTSSQNFQHHYGLLRDDYSAKPAFGAYRALIAALAR